MAKKDVRTDRIGTEHYYFHSGNTNFSYPKNKFTAPSERAAKTAVLKKLMATRNSGTYWKFCHECSKNRGFEAETDKGTIRLFHILRND